MIHSDDVSIVIPSRERHNSLRTWGALPPMWKDRATVLVHHYEKEAYQLANPHAHVSSCHAKGIGSVRQFIIDNAKTEWVMMLDDDLYFYRRARPGGIRLVGADNAGMHEMFRILLEAMDNGYIHGGVTARPTTSFWACRYRVCQRVNNFHYFHGPTFKRHASFTRLEVMEDFDASLSLLRAGYPNFVLFDYCWNQPGSNTAGGCSSYRSNSVQHKAAHDLAKLHSGIVRVRTKRVRGQTSWEGMKERTDVVVQWRESFKGGWHPHWELEKFYNTLKMPKEFWT